MRKILIISPHFPPSNLAAVHRSRLFARHLPSFGWEPIILTVDGKFYEEDGDDQLTGLLPANLKIEKVNAFGITSPRIIGDIGLRAFFQLYRRAKQIIQRDRIDFLYIPIPSFYTALLGRWLHFSTGIPYGIDYIDPWVHTFPGSQQIFSRHWWSTRLAKLLEPVAVKKATLITGVSEKYYEPVLERNPLLKAKAINDAMPYGGEIEDHVAVKQLGLKPYLFQNKADKVQLVYAGAMLPNAYKILEDIFESIRENFQVFNTTEFHFIGTGKTANDAAGYNVKPLAEKHGLWQEVVFEYPKRIPYLDVLVHLEAANGIFILGSTEAHYSPSKVYQGILSGKPLLAVLHKESTAVKVIESTGAGVVLSFEESDAWKIGNEFPGTYKEFLKMACEYNFANINMNALDEYSAGNITRKLADLLNKAIALKD
ncbi:MAG TPA: hypothetical protein VFT78_09985 [Hanamia sp.]|nr:hypothetical protein [Hanamia sp.]